MRFASERLQRWKKKEGVGGPGIRSKWNQYVDLWQDTKGLETENWITLRWIDKDMPWEFHSMCCCKCPTVYLSSLIGVVSPLSPDRNRRAMAVSWSTIGQFIFNRFRGLGCINYAQRWLEHTNIDPCGWFWFSLLLRCAAKSYLMTVAKGQEVSISSKLLEWWVQCPAYFNGNLFLEQQCTRIQRLFPPRS